MAACFVLAAHRLRQDVPDVHFVCPMASRETRDMFERRCAATSAPTCR